MNTTSIKYFQIKEFDKNLPLVSIIIPCYNYGKFLEEAIDSVKKQTLFNHEIIIVDDGSTDIQTLNILKKIKRSGIKVISQKNSKVVTARNNGIKEAKGKYICCLDADDKLEPTYLEMCVLKMETEKLDFCGSWIQLFGDYNDVWETSDLNIFEIINANNTLGSSVFTKDIWKKVGGYKKEMDIGYEDWEFWIAIAEIGARGRMVKEPLFLYRRHLDSKSNTDKTLNNLIIKEIHRLHPKLYTKNSYSLLKNIRKIQTENYLAKNPLINIKNSVVDSTDLISKQIILAYQDIFSYREKIEKFDEVKNSLVYERDSLQQKLWNIENSFSYKSVSLLRRKFLNKIFPEKSRKKIFESIKKHKELRNSLKENKNKTQNAFTRSINYILGLHYIKKLSNYLKYNSKKVAVFIINYNMPEKTDSLYEYLKKNGEYPIDIYVIDNGSDLASKSRYTNVFIEKNVQTTGGWLRGLEEADKKPYKYFAYMFLITSAEFTKESKGPVASMAEILHNDSNAVGVHASLTKNSTTYWNHLKNRKTESYRRTWFIDNIASLYRADWFDSIGRFDKDLIYAWGIDLETCYKARKQKRGIYIDDRIQVRKITNIGYKMKRMNMTSTQREILAGKNMKKILLKKYGAQWERKMLYDYVEESWK